MCFQKHLGCSVLPHGNFNENPSMRAVAKIARARGGEHSCNFCEQFEQRPNFASTFKLNGTIRYPYIRKYLSSTTNEILVHAFVSSKLDNCNSLLYGLPNYQVKKLQHVQNAAALASLFQENMNTLRLFCYIFTGFRYVIVLCLKFYSSRTRLLTILLHPIFAIYSHLTFHLVNYFHRLKIFL